LSIAVARPPDLLWGVISALALIVGAAGALLIRRKPVRTDKRNENTPQGELEITPWPDPGKVHMQADQSSGPDFELRLRPVGDAGIQDIEPHEGLVQQESIKT
jgi:hypothetical protein